MELGDSSERIGGRIAASKQIGTLQVDQQIKLTWIIGALRI